MSHDEYENAKKEKIAECPNPDGCPELNNLEESESKLNLKRDFEAFESEQAKIENIEQRLSDNDKKDLYYAFLEYLNDKSEINLFKHPESLNYNYYNILELSGEIQFKYSPNISEQGHRILIIMFFALYKAKDEQDLITNLEEILLNIFEVLYGDMFSY